jgi:hypothetical protein
MVKLDIPRAFVWTKMQGEAGEGIQGIRNRKELERLAGGSFWWGIGESKSQSITLLRHTEPKPIVIFSLMRTPAHARDAEPDGVVLWQAFLSDQRERPIPAHVVVTSSAHSRNGSPKRRHFALVCESAVSLRKSGGGSLDAGTLRNFGENGRPIGSSQVTAVVEHNGLVARSLLYPISARAWLTSPFIATLTSPRPLSQAERRLLREVGEDGNGVEDWLAVVTRLRPN